MHNISIDFILLRDGFHAAAIGHQQRKDAGNKPTVVQLEGKAK
jgi:hypothetical protein